MCYQKPFRGNSTLELTGCYSYADLPGSVTASTYWEWLARHREHCVPVLGVLNIICFTCSSLFGTESCFLCLNHLFFWLRYLLDLQAQYCNVTLQSLSLLNLLAFFCSNISSWHILFVNVFCSLSLSLVLGVCICQPRITIHDKVCWTIERIILQYIC